MTDAAAAASALAQWPGIGDAVAGAREAMTSLRWHEALRRRIPEARTESQIRGAVASSELDGAPGGIAEVRGWVHAASWPAADGAQEATLVGALRATMAAGELGAVVTQSPRQALTRIHAAASADLSPPAERGRPRGNGQECGEGTDLPPAPQGDELAARIDGICELMGALNSAPVPAIAALVHAELIVTRPFSRANGVVARAIERGLLVAGGLDPTGVSVPELGHLRGGSAPYRGALAAYATGSPDGVRLWLEHACAAYVSAAAAGADVADAVRRGRLDS